MPLSLSEQDRRVLTVATILLAGEEMPGGDEVALRRVAASMGGLSGEFGRVLTGFERTARSLDGAVSPDVLDGMRRHLRRLDAAGGSWSGSAAGNGPMLERYGLQNESAKYSILMESVLTLAQLTWALSTPFTAALVPAIVARARHLVTVVLDRLRRNLGLLLALAATEEAVQEGLQELLVQLIQMAEGHRHAVDWRDVGIGAGIGAGAGLVAGALGAAALVWFSRLGQAARAAVVESLTELIVSAALIPLAGGGSMLWAAVLNGAFSGGAGVHAQRWGQRMADHHNGSPDRTPDLEAPPPTEQPPAIPPAAPPPVAAPPAAVLPVAAPPVTVPTPAGATPPGAIPPAPTPGGGNASRSGGSTSAVHSGQSVSGERSGASTSTTGAGATATSAPGSSGAAAPTADQATADRAAADHGDTARPADALEVGDRTTADRTTADRVTAEAHDSARTTPPVVADTGPVAPVAAVAPLGGQSASDVTGAVPVDQGVSTTTGTGTAMTGPTAAGFPVAVDAPASVVVADQGAPNTTGDVVTSPAEVRAVTGAPVTGTATPSGPTPDSALSNDTVERVLGKQDDSRRLGERAAEIVRTENGRHGRRDPMGHEGAAARHHEIVNRVALALHRANPPATRTGRDLEVAGAEEVARSLVSALPPDPRGRRPFPAGGGSARGEQDDDLDTPGASGSGAAPRTSAEPERVSAVESPSPARDLRFRPKAGVLSGTDQVARLDSFAAEVADRVMAGEHVRVVVRAGSPGARAARVELVRRGLLDRVRDRLVTSGASQSLIDHVEVVEDHSTKGTSAEDVVSLSWAVVPAPVPTESPLSDPGAVRSSGRVEVVFRPKKGVLSGTDQAVRLDSFAVEVADRVAAGEDVRVVVRTGNSAASSSARVELVRRGVEARVQRRLRAIGEPGSSVGVMTVVEEHAPGGTRDEDVVSLSWAVESQHADPSVSVAAAEPTAPADEPSFAPDADDRPSEQVLVAFRPLRDALHADEPRRLDALVERIVSGVRAAQREGAPAPVITTTVGAGALAVARADRFTKAMTWRLESGFARSGLDVDVPTLMTEVAAEDPDTVRFDVRGLPDTVRSDTAPRRDGHEVSETFRFRQDGRALSRKGGQSRALSTLADRVTATLLAGGGRVDAVIVVAGDGRLARERFELLEAGLLGRVRALLVSKGYSSAQIDALIGRVAVIRDRASGGDEHSGTITVSGLSEVGPDDPADVRSPEPHGVGFKRGSASFGGHPARDALDAAADDIVGEVLAEPVKPVRVRLRAGGLDHGTAKGRYLARKREVRVEHSLRQKVARRLAKAEVEDVERKVDEVFAAPSAPDDGFTKVAGTEQVAVLITDSGDRTLADTKSHGLPFRRGSSTLAVPSTLDSIVRDLADRVVESRRYGLDLPVVSVHAFSNGADHLSVRRAKGLRRAVLIRLTGHLRRRGLRNPDADALSVVPKHRAYGLGEHVGALHPGIGDMTEARRTGLLTITGPTLTLADVRTEWGERFTADHAALDDAPDREPLRQQADAVLGAFTPADGVPATIRDDALDTVALLVRSDPDEAVRTAREITRVFAADAEQETEVTLLDEVRANRVETVEAPDGAALRDTVASLLDADEDLRARIDTAFSDVNLRAGFRKAVDGGTTSRIGGGPLWTVPEVTVRVVSVGRRRRTARPDVHDESVAFDTTFRSESHTDRERGAPGITLRLATPVLIATARFGFLRNHVVRRGEATSVDTSTVRVVLSKAHTVTSEHDVTYEITVRGALGAPRRAAVDVPTVLRFRLSSEQPPAPDRATRPVPVAAEFAGTGSVLHEIRRQTGRAGNRLGTVDHEVEQWLDGLVEQWVDGVEESPDHPKSVVVHREFAFGRLGRKLVVTIVIDEPTSSATIVRGAGQVIETVRADRASTVTRQVARGDGVGVRVMGGVPFGGAGLSAEVTHVVTDRDERTESATTERTKVVDATVELHTRAVRFTVSVAPPGDVDPLSTPRPVPVTLSRWFRHAPVARPVDRSGPTEEHVAAVQAMPDRLDTVFRLEHTVATQVAERIVVRLRAGDVIREDDRDRVVRSLTRFLEVHAADVTNAGDVIRYPLGQVRSSYPDLLLDGVLDRRDPRPRGAVAGDSWTTRTVQGSTTTADVETVAVIGGGVPAYVVAPPVVVITDADVARENARVSHRESGVFAGRLHRGGSTTGLREWRFVFHLRVRVDVTGSLLLVVRDEVDVQASLSAVLRDLPRDDAPTPDEDWVAPLAETDDHDTTRLPADHDIVSLRPVPGLSDVLQEVLHREGVWWNAVTRVFVGSRHSGVGHRGVLSSTLLNFADRQTRIARIGLATSPAGDVLETFGPQSHGLFASRQQHVHVTLKARLSRPRVVRLDAEHRFSADTTVRSDGTWAEKNQVSGRIAFDGGLGYSVARALTLAAPAEGEVVVGASRTTETGDSRDVVATTDFLERAYLVVFDVEYRVEGKRHVRRTAQGNALSAWVPASRIGRIGPLAEADLDLLTEADRAAYTAAREALAESERESDPGASRESPGTVAAAVEDRAVDSAEAAVAGGAAEVVVRAHAGVGHGVGTVAFTGATDAADIAAVVSEALRGFGTARDTSASGGRAVLGRAFGDARVAIHLSRLADSLVDRMAVDLTPGRAETALAAMLNGGWTLYLAQTTALGRIEQAVVVRASLGEGRYVDTTNGVGSGTATSRTSVAARTSEAFLRTGGLAGGALIMAARGRPGGLLALSAGGGAQFSWATQTGSQQSETTVDPADADPVDHFLHDLVLSVEIHPMASLAGRGQLRHLDPSAVWTSQPKALPNAVRSSVGVSYRPHTTASGSEQGAPVTWGSHVRRPAHPLPGASIVARPFSARGLTGVLRELGAHHPGGLRGVVRPALPPIVRGAVMTALAGHLLGHRMRDVLSPDGYRLALAAGPLDAVVLRADVVIAGLVAELAPLTTTGTESTSVSDTSRAAGSFVVTGVADIRAPLVGNSQYRSNALGNTAPITLSSAAGEQRTRYDTAAVVPAEPASRRFLVEVTPRWRVTPEYRSSAVRRAWGTPLITDPDEPVLVEVDEEGLRFLGLSPQDLDDASEHVDESSLTRYLRGSQDLGPAAQIGDVPGDPVREAVTRLLHPELTGGEAGVARRLRQPAHVEGLAEVLTADTAVNPYLGHGVRFPIKVNGTSYEIAVQARFDWGRARPVGDEVDVPVGYTASAHLADGATATGLLRSATTVEVTETTSVRLRLPEVDTVDDLGLGEAVTAGVPRHFEVEALGDSTPEGTPGAVARLLPAASVAIGGEGRAALAQAFGRPALARTLPLMVAHDPSGDGEAGWIVPDWPLTTPEALVRTGLRVRAVPRWVVVLTAGRQILDFELQVRFPGIPPFALPGRISAHVRVGPDGSPGTGHAVRLGPARRWHAPAGVESGRDLVRVAADTAGLRGLVGAIRPLVPGARLVGVDVAAFAERFEDFGTGQLVAARVDSLLRLDADPGLALTPESLGALVRAVATTGLLVPLRVRSGGVVRRVDVEVTGRLTDVGDGVLVADGTAREFGAVLRTVSTVVVAEPGRAQAARYGAAPAVSRDVALRFEVDTALLRHVPDEQVDVLDSPPAVDDVVRRDRPVLDGVRVRFGGDPADLRSLAIRLLADASGAEVDHETSARLHRDLGPTALESASPLNLPVLVHGLVVSARPARVVLRFTPESLSRRAAPDGVVEVTMTVRVLVVAEAENADGVTTRAGATTVVPGVTALVDDTQFDAVERLAATGREPEVIAVRRSPADAVIAVSSAGVVSRGATRVRGRLDLDSLRTRLVALVAPEHTASFSAIPPLDHGVQELIDLAGNGGLLVTSGTGGAAVRITVRFAAPPEVVGYRPPTSAGAPPIAEYRGTLVVTVTAEHAGPPVSVTDEVPVSLSRSVLATGVPADHGVVRATPIPPQEPAAWWEGDRPTIHSVEHLHAPVSGIRAAAHRALVDAGVPLTASLTAAVESALTPALVTDHVDALVESGHVVALPVEFRHNLLLSLRLGDARTVDVHADGTTTRLVDAEFRIDVAPHGRETLPGRPGTLLNAPGARPVATTSLAVSGAYTLRVAGTVGVPAELVLAATDTARAMRGWAARATPTGDDEDSTSSLRAQREQDAFWEARGRQVRLVRAHTSTPSVHIGPHDSLEPSVAVLVDAALVAEANGFAPPAVVLRGGAAAIRSRHPALRNLLHRGITGVFGDFGAPVVDIADILDTTLPAGHIALHVTGAVIADPTRLGADAAAVVRGVLPAGPPPPPDGVAGHLLAMAVVAPEGGNGVAVTPVDGGAAVPHVVHAVALGGPLVDTRHRTALAAIAAAEPDALTVVWTDLPRSAFDAPTPVVAEFVEWGRSAGVAVIPLDAVLGADPAALPGYADARADHALDEAALEAGLELLRRFGGVHVDGRRAYDGVRAPITAAAETGGFGIRRDASSPGGVAGLVAPAGHPALDRVRSDAGGAAPVAPAGHPVLTHDRSAVDGPGVVAPAGYSAFDRVRSDADGSAFVAVGDPVNPGAPRRLPVAFVHAEDQQAGAALVAEVAWMITRQVARDGRVDLVAAFAASRRHEQPEAVLDAALLVVAGNGEVRDAVRSILVRKPGERPVPSAPVAKWFVLADGGTAPAIAASMPGRPVGPVFDTATADGIAALLRDSAQWRVGTLDLLLAEPFVDATADPTATWVEVLTLLAAAPDAHGVDAVLDSRFTLGVPAHRVELPEQVRQLLVVTGEWADPHDGPVRYAARFGGPDVSPTHWSTEFEPASTTEFDQGPLRALARLLAAGGRIGSVAVAGNAPTGQARRQGRQRAQEVAGALRLLLVAELRRAGGNEQVVPRLVPDTLVDSETGSPERASWAGVDLYLITGSDPRDDLVPERLDTRSPEFVVTPVRDSRVGVLFAGTGPAHHLGLARAVLDNARADAGRVPVTMRVRSGDPAFTAAARVRLVAVVSRFATSLEPEHTVDVAAHLAVFVVRADGTRLTLPDGDGREDLGLGVAPSLGVLADETWRRDPSETADWMTPDPSGPPDTALRVHADVVAVRAESSSRRRGGGVVRQTIAYYLRRFEAWPGAWVQDYAVLLHVRRDPTVSEELATVVLQAAEGAVRRLFSPGYRLPSGDVFLAGVEFVDDPSRAHAVITLATTGETTQSHWNVTAASANTWAHEFGHYLGLHDEYQEGGDARVFQRHEPGHPFGRVMSSGLYSDRETDPATALHPRHLWLVEWTMRGQVLPPATDFATLVERRRDAVVVAEPSAPPASDIRSGPVVVSAERPLLALVDTDRSVTEVRSNDQGLVPALAHQGADQAVDQLVSDLIEEAYASSGLVGRHLIHPTVPAAPSFLARPSFDDYPTAKLVALFRALDLQARIDDGIGPNRLASGEHAATTPRDRSARATRQGGAFEMPRVVHTVKLGGPLLDRGVMANLARTAALLREAGRGGVVVVWTDVTRSLVLSARLRGDRTDPVLVMADWATDNGIVLVDVREVFTTGNPTALAEEFWAEHARGVVAGYRDAARLLVVQLAASVGGAFVDGRTRAVSAPVFDTVVSGRRGHLVNDFAGADLLVARHHPEAVALLGLTLGGARSARRLRYPDADRSMPLRPVPGPPDSLPPFTWQETDVPWGPPPYAFEQVRDRLTRSGRQDALVLPVFRFEDVLRVDERIHVRELVRGVAAALVHDLHHRTGDLDFAALAPRLSSSPHAPLVWRAALRFIAGVTTFRTMVRSASVGGVDDALLAVLQEFIVFDPFTMTTRFGEVRASATMRGPGAHDPAADIGGLVDALHLGLTLAARPTPTTSRSLGDDPFSLRTPRRRPVLLVGVTQAALSTDRVVPLLAALDLRRPEPPPGQLIAVEGLPETVSTSTRPVGGRPPWAPATGIPRLPPTLAIPRVLHAIWLGGPLDNPVFLGRFAESARAMAAQGFLSVLWTDLTRADFATATPNSPDERVRRIHDMAVWAATNGITLVGVHEVFHAEEPMVLNDEFGVVLTWGDRSSFAAASDILRMEVLHRFGGVYSDGDNVVVDLPLGGVLDSDSALGIHFDPHERRLSNAAFIVPRGHPFPFVYLDEVRSRYAQERSTLMPYAVEPLTGRAVDVRRNDLWLRLSPVIVRGGPIAFAHVLHRLGLTMDSWEAMAIRGISFGDERSWTKSLGAAARVPLHDRAATLALAARAATALLHSAAHRAGDLDLFGVAESLRGHERPDVLLAAAVEFVASRVPVRSITPHRYDLVTAQWSTVAVPPTVRRLLVRTGPSDWLGAGEIRVPVAVQPGGLPKPPPLPAGFSFDLAPTAAVPASYAPFATLLAMCAIERDLAGDPAPLATVTHSGGRGRAVRPSLVEAVEDELHRLGSLAPAVLARQVVVEEVAPAVPGRPDRIYVVFSERTGG